MKQKKGLLGLIATDEKSQLVSQENQSELAVHLRILIHKTISALIREFHQNATQSIAHKTSQNNEYQERLELLDASTNLQISEKLLIDGYCDKFNQNLQLLASSATEQTKETRAEFSLMEHGDFDDLQNLSVIIKKLESQFDSALVLIRKKLAAILDTKKENIIIPANPASLCEGFREILVQIERSEQVKNFLYLIFEETLIKYLPVLYKQVIIIIDEQETTKKTSSTVSSTSPQWKKFKTESVHSDIFDIAAKQSDVVARSHPDKEELNEEPLNIEDQLPHDNDDEIKTPSVNAEDISTPDPIPPRNRRSQSPDRPENQNQNTKEVINVVSHLVSLLQAKNNIQNPQSERPEEVHEDYSANEVHSAFSQLQQNIKNENELFSPELLLQKLKQTLKNDSAHLKQLSRSDNKKLEIYDSLFNVLFDENMLGQDSQSYVQKIQLPIMAQAVQDPKFLSTEDHPARNVINHLYWLESAIKNQKSSKNIKLKQTIDDLINQIRDQSINNPSIFGSVEKELSDITQSVNKTVTHNEKRVQNIYEGKQKLEKARGFVQNEINELYANKKFPKVIFTLLEAGWQHLLVLAKLKGDDSAYQNHFTVINDLNAWLMGSKSIDLESAKNTLEIIDKELQPVCSDVFLHSNLLNVLNDFLLTNKISSSTDSVEMTTLELDESSQAVTETENRTNEVNQLKPDQWLNIFLNKKLESVKLIWISDNKETFVFVDRAGMKRLVLKRENLAKLIRSGSVTIIDSLDLPVMDRATNAMLQKLQDEVTHNATCDPVTHLLNRKEFTKQLKKQLTNIENTKFLLCNIEIQDFRIITNACGLSGGDALLIQLADQIKALLRTEDIVARLDDRTFSILLNNCSAEVAKKLHDELIGTDFNWEDKSFSIAVGMGIVPLFSENSYKINTILQQADSATLSAIDAGRNRIRVYKEDDKSLQSQFDSNEWVGRINQVFSENRLFLRCQKIVEINTQSDTHTHYEILLGIKDEQGNTIPPDNFIPAVERCHRMSEVDKWVVNSVFDWVETHPAIFEKLDGFSINLSGESMNSEEFLEFLKETLSTCNVPLHKITFEITETVAADSFQFVQTFIEEIKAFNCKFSLDDFGSGYSSYSYLKSLDVDYLKIDGIFVKDLTNNNTDIAIVKSMNEIAHSLNLKTIAEYVENKEIQDVLEKIGVDFAQGWGVEKPKLITDLELETEFEFESKPEIDTIATEPVIETKVEVEPEIEYDEIVFEDDLFDEKKW